MKSYFLAVAAVLCLAGGFWTRQISLEHGQFYARRYSEMAEDAVKSLKKLEFPSSAAIDETRKEVSRFDETGREIYRRSNLRGSLALVAGAALAVGLGALAVRYGTRKTPT